MQEVDLIKLQIVSISIWHLEFNFWSIASRVRATPSSAMPAICLDEKLGDDMDEISPEEDECDTRQTDPELKGIR